MANRLRGRCGYSDGNPFALTLHPARLNESLKWKKPQRIFVCSMGDWLHDEVPVKFIREIIEIINLCPEHTFLTLTKRPQNFGKKFMAALLPSQLLGFLPNLWLGVSVEDQQTADERIPKLLETPAAKKFVSYEPALGPVDFSRWLPQLNWLIMGGETGPGARPMNVEWARSVRDQCRAAGIPFFFKQMSGKIPVPPDLKIQEKGGKIKHEPQSKEATGLDIVKE